MSTVAFDNTAPLLEANGNGGGGSWWMKEAKKQVCFALPMIVTNLFYYLITLVSVMFAGHHGGQLHLAAATLANSWAFVSGFCFMAGLSGGLETLCGQGFGAKEYKTLGLYLQSSCVISISCSILVSILWLYTQPILISLHQDPTIATAAALYIKCLIPGLFAYALIQNILRFLQTQSIATPLVLLSGIPMALHFAVIHLVVDYAGVGFHGAALAASITLWISFVLLAIYVCCSGRCKQTWQGFSGESLHYIPRKLHLALSSAAMLCLEEWAFELLVVLAGLMPNSQVTTSLTAICVNTETVAFMMTYGLSAAASTRVSNALGAGNPEEAKKAMARTLKLSIVLAMAVISALALGRDVWAGFFSNSLAMIKEFRSMTPLLACSITLDAVQGVLSGVARGCGRQHFAVYTNLATFYCVGMPIGLLLGFGYKLYAKGLWIGLICGLFCQASALLIITWMTKWNKIDISAETSNTETSKATLSKRCSRITCSTNCM